MALKQEVQGSRHAQAAKDEEQNEMHVFSRSLDNTEQRKDS
jgi:hypothetical protein